MSGCTNRRYREMLHQYELGLLSEMDRQAFELHLLDCDACCREVDGFKKVAGHLRYSPKVRQCIEAALAQDGRQSVTAPEPKRRSGWTTLVPTSLVAAAVLVLLILQPWQIKIETSDDLIASENRIAVLPFDNMVDPSDSSLVGQMVSRLLITDLSQSHFVDVVSAQRLRDIVRLLDDRSGEEPVDTDLSIRVAERSDARWTLTGEVMQVEPTIVIAARLTDASTGVVAASHRVETEADEDLFALVDRLTVQIKDELTLPHDARAEMDAPISEMTTRSYEAYRHFVEGQEYLGSLEYSDAERSFRRALEYDSTLAMAYYFLAALGDHHQLEKAIEYSDGASEKDRLFIRILEASLAGDHEKHVSLLRETVRRYPDAKVALVQLAVSEIAASRRDEAIELLNRAIAVDSLYGIAYNRLAYLYSRMGQVENALRTVDKYAEIAPDEASPHDTRADILIASGRLEDAIASMERVCEINPGFLDYSCQLKLAKLYTFHGDYDKATDRLHVATANALRSIRSTARTVLALIPTYQGKFTEALALLDDGIAADRMELATSGLEGDRALKHFVKSLIFMEIGDFDRAVYEHEMAVDVHSEVVARYQQMYRCTYAQSLAEAGEFDQADSVTGVLRAEYEGGSMRSGGAYHYAAGCTELARGRADAAVSHLEKAVEIEPALDFRLMLGRARLAAGQYSQTAQELERLVDGYPYDWSMVLSIWVVKSHYYLGQTYEATGEGEQAIAHYERFLDIWKDADPGLEAVVDARLRLARLKSDS